MIAVKFDKVKHMSKNCRVIWKNLLRWSFQPPLKALERVVKPNTIPGELVSRGVMKVSYSANNILQMTIATRSRHQLKKQTKIYW